MDSSYSDHHHHHNHPDEDIDLISHRFNQQIDLQAHVQDEDHTTISKSEEDDHNDHNNDEEDDNDDDDFTFMLIGHHDGPNFDDEVFEDGRIQPVFPLFDQNLLSEGEYHIEEIDRLPIHPPVDKIFVESPRGFPSSKHEENDDDAAAGPYCTWSKDSATTSTATAGATAELSKKSNSTGFSKLWRLKEKVGRSNSDGRDAFVFLKSSHKSTTTTKATTTTETTTTTTATKASVEGTYVKVNVAGGKAKVVKQGAKGKKSSVSAHEAYLKSKGGHTEEDRRRSFLPYRPELMGLFTNVHGGLTKNVHPY